VCLGTTRGTRDRTGIEWCTASLANLGPVDRKAAATYSLNDLDGPGELVEISALESR
jgi:hypothetical protein